MSILPLPLLRPWWISWTTVGRSFTEKSGLKQMVAWISMDRSFNKSTNRSPFLTFTRRPYKPDNSSSSEYLTSYQNQKQKLDIEREELLAEAKYLTLKLYRSIVRSVRVIRYGNEHDEVEFQQREKERTDSLDASVRSDVRMSMLSMLPPVDREDELRSRAEYYQQYARENFVQESDCFPKGSDDNWDEQHIKRYLYHLRRGEDHRKWLLNDMKFVDPYDNNNDDDKSGDNRQSSWDDNRVSNFETNAIKFVKKLRNHRMQSKLSPQEYQVYLDRQSEASLAPTDVTKMSNEDDGWSSDEDENDARQPLKSVLHRNPRST